MTVTLWGETAGLNPEKVDHAALEPGRLIALRNCKVSQYMGVSLNASSDFQDIYFKLNHPRATELKRWFGQRKISEHLQTCTNVSQGISSVGVTNNGVVSIAEMNAIVEADAAI